MVTEPVFAAAGRPEGLIPLLQAVPNTPASGTPTSKSPTGEVSSGGALAKLQGVCARLDGVCGEVAGLTDEDLIEGIRAAEEVGRILDAFRVRTAGEVERRSTKNLKERRLSGRYGCRTATELLERLTQASTTEIRNRIKLDRLTHTSPAGSGGTALTSGAAHFPTVGEAFFSGKLGRDAAELVTGKLARIAHQADPEATAGAEAELVGAATAGQFGPLAGGTTNTVHDGAASPAADRAPQGPGAPRPTLSQLKDQANHSTRLLQTTGPRHDAQKAARRRSLTFGTPQDGLVPIFGKLMPETAAGLQQLLNSYLNPAAQRSAAKVGAAPSGDTPADWATAPTPEDSRTPEQKRHDVLGSIVIGATRSASTPTLGGEAPTLMVHAKAEDLADPEGSVTADGVDIPLPVDFAHRMACTGAVQKLVFGSNGRATKLTSKERTFTANQRKAIAARDGGCVIPGCSIPSAWCEVHHVTPWADRGETDTDNGVLLCWWHHHHLDASGWKIRMTAGIPEIKAPDWIERNGPYRAAPNARTRDIAPPNPRTLQGTDHQPEQGHPKDPVTPLPDGLAGSPAPAETQDRSAMDHPALLEVPDTHSPGTPAAQPLRLAADPDARPMVEPAHRTEPAPGQRTTGQEIQIGQSGTRADGRGTGSARYCDKPRSIMKPATGVPSTGPRSPGRNSTGAYGHSRSNANTPDSRDDHRCLHHVAT